MSALFNRKNLIWVLCAVFLIIYLLPIANHPLLEPDEGRYAEIPREMIESGDYVTPMLNYVKYFEKPVLLYWLNAASFRLLGESAFAARLPVALTALLGIAAVGMFGAYLYGRRAGVLAAVVTGTSLLYYAIGTINITDMPVALCLTLTVTSFYTGARTKNRKWYLAGYVAMALGTLTKGLIAIVLPGGVLLSYILITRRWRLIPDMLYLPGIAAFFAVASPWFYLVCRENPDFFRFFFIQEHFLRYATKIHDRYEPFWYFIPFIPAGLMPWTGFFLALGGRGSALRTPANATERDARLFLLLWFGVIFLFFSASSSKLIPYVVPCIPPIALLMACDMDRMISGTRPLRGALVLNTAICALFSTALLGYVILGDELPRAQGLAVAVPIAAALLGAGALALRRSRNRAEPARPIATLCLGALLFALCLQSIYPPLGRDRSVASVVQALRENRLPTETMAVYGEVLHGLPFYMKERVMLVDYMGELEYGALQAEGTGWFPDRETFLQDWANGVPLALVIEKKRLPTLFPDGATDVARQAEAGDYVVLFNSVHR